MAKMLIFVAAFIGGIALSVEAAIGGALGENIGELETSYYIFPVGFLVLSPFVLFLKKGSLSQITKMPKWELSGGLLGVTYLVLLLISVMAVGVGISMTTVIIGQIIMSIMIDHFGWLGTKQIKFNRNRFIAIILLVGSLFLIL